MLYMIIEHFKNDDPVPVYRRFRDRGHPAPNGLQYISSWVDEKLNDVCSLHVAHWPNPSAQPNARRRAFAPASVAG